MRVLPDNLSFASATPTRRQLSTGVMWLAMIAPTAVSAAAAVSHRDAEPDAAQAVELTPVVVTATRYAVPITEAPALVSIVGRPQIERRNAYRLGDVLGEAPGLVLRGSAFGESFPASGNGAITLRGVPRSPRTLVLVDGHPLNNALSGAIDLASVNLDEVDRIEVVNGPYSAQYGGDAMGGVIQIFTAAPKARAISLSIGAGAGDIQQHGASAVWRDRVGRFAWVASVGTRWSKGWSGSDEVVVVPSAGRGVATVTGAERTSTPDDRTAYRVGIAGERPWDQRNAGLSLYYDFGDRTQASAGVTHSTYHTRFTRPVTFLTDAAGRQVFSGDLAVNGGAQRLVLSQADFLTQTPSGERDLRLFGSVVHRAPGGGGVSVYVSYLEHGFRFPQAASTANYDSGPGEFADQPNNRIDVDLSGRFALRRGLDLTAGGSLSRQTLHRYAYAVAYWRDFNSRTGVNAESSGKTWNQAAYAELKWAPLKHLTVYGGARYDHFETEGRAVQYTAPAFDRVYHRRHDDSLVPKLALVYRPTATLTLRASYGEGFHAPTLLDLYTRSTSPTGVAGQFTVVEASADLKPEGIRAKELGAEWSRDGNHFRLAYYQQTLTDLFYRQRVTSLLSQVVNAGEAKVDGLEVGFSWALAPGGVRLFGTATRQFRYTITRNDALPASVGKKIPDVPAFSGALGVEGEWGAWTAYAVVRRVGHAFGSRDNLNANTVEGVFGSWDGSTVADARIARRLSPSLTLSVSTSNLLNSKYYEFYRQPGRTFFIEIRGKIH